MNLFRFKSRFLIAHDIFRDTFLPFVLVVLAFVYVWMMLILPILQAVPAEDDSQFYYQKF